MADQFRALVADGRGKYALEAITIGEPQGDEVCVEIRAAGLCHTDWDSIQSWDYPFVVGHEGAGIVRAVGPDVTQFKPGDRVMLNWAIPCGHCSPCADGRRNICAVNSPVTGDGSSGHAHPQATMLDGAPLKRSFHLGTMSERTIVREAAVTPLADGVPFAVAAAMGCAVMTGFGSVVNAAKVRAGSAVAVIGCGGVGLNVLQAARIAGAGRIFAIDVNADKLAAAQELGASDVIVPAREDASFAGVRAEIEALLGAGADYAFECTAIPALGAAPLALVKNGGTAVQVSGIEQVIDFDCELFEWDKIYINPLYGQCNPGRDFPALQALYLSGQLQLDRLISRTYPLEEAAQAFDDLLSGRLLKGVFLLGEGDD